MLVTAEPLPPPDDTELAAQLAELAALRERLGLLPAGDRVRHGLHLVGRARKVSVSMPEDLTAAIQQRVGQGRFSQYVTEAVARQLELDLLAELSEVLEAEHGPVSEEALAEARSAWPDA
jgi:Arc/MetJ-type ribon-helix-helix transcriptional regulator